MASPEASLGLSQAAHDGKNAANAGPREEKTVGAAAAETAPIVDRELPVLDPRRLDKIPREFFMALERSNYGAGAAGSGSVALIAGRSDDAALAEMLRRRQEQLGAAVQQLQHRCCGGRNPLHRNHHDCLAELIARERRKREGTEGEEEGEEEEEVDEEGDEEGEKLRQKRQLEKETEVIGRGEKDQMRERDQMRQEAKKDDLSSLVREAAKKPRGGDKEKEEGEREEEEEDEEECYDVSELIRRFQLLDKLSRKMFFFPLGSSFLSSFCAVVPFLFFFSKSASETCR